jgi:hypothetical protein
MHAPHEGLLQARFAVLRAQPRGRPVPAHAAFFQHRDRRAQLLDIGEDVRGEKERPALGGETPQQIAAATGIKISTVKVNVRRMVDDDQLDTDGEGRYFLRSGVTPVTGVTQPDDELHGLQGLHLIPGGDSPA